MYVTIKLLRAKNSLEINSAVLTFIVSVHLKCLFYLLDILMFSHVIIYSLLIFDNNSVNR